MIIYPTSIMQFPLWLIIYAIDEKKMREKEPKKDRDNSYMKKIAIEAAINL